MRKDMSLSASVHHRYQRAALVLMTVALAACCDPLEPSRAVNEGDVLSEGEGSCALSVTFRGERYEGRRVLVEPPLGEGLGEAVIPACNDPNGGGSAGDERIPVVELKGTDPSVAVVWEGQPSSIFVREDIDPLPSELQTYFERPVCDPSREPIHLFGPWIGIIQPNQTTELDLIPPYDLELLVSRGSSPEYRGADLSVRVPASAGRLVSKEDIRTSLWKGGSIEMTVRCAGDRFLAQTVETYPG
jgi:uncharacterized protein DUF6281